MRLLTGCVLVSVIVVISAYSGCAAKKLSAVATADQSLTATAMRPDDDLGGGIIASALDAPAEQIGASIKPRVRNLGECMTSTTANKLVDKTGKNLKIDRIAAIIMRRIEHEKVTLVPVGRCRLNGNVTLKEGGGVATYQIALYITNMATKEILWSSSQHLKIKTAGVK